MSGRCCRSDTLVSHRTAAANRWRGRGRWSKIQQGIPVMQIQLQVHTQLNKDERRVPMCPKIDASD